MVSRQPDAFQAVVGVYLLTLHALASTLCIGPSYADVPERRASTLPFVVVSVVLSNIAIPILGMLVGLHARTIGPSIECNDVVKFQILFLQLSAAEADGKAFILALSIFYLVCFLGFTAFQLAIWIRRGGWKGGEMTPDCLAFTLDHFRKGREPGYGQHICTNIFLEHRLYLATEVMYTIWSCSIISVEYTLHLNSVRGTSSSGFGQVSCRLDSTIQPLWSSLTIYRLSKQVLALFTLAVPLEAIARWATQRAPWQTSGGLSFGKTWGELLLVRLFYVVADVVQALFAPLILLWILIRFTYRVAMHRSNGRTPEPNSTQNWKPPNIGK